MSSPRFCKYQYGICGPDVKEMIKANVMCEKIITLGKDQKLTDDMKLLIGNRSLVLFGSHWSRRQVRELEKLAFSVHIVVTRKRDLTKYTGNLVISLQEDHTEISDQELQKEFPWLIYLDELNGAPLSEAEKRRRRNSIIDGEIPEEDPNIAEYFYRGFLDLGKEHGYYKIQDLLAATVKRILPIDIEKCIRYGHNVYKHRTLIAEELVESAIYLQIHGYSACFVFGGGQPDVPLLTLAADHADIGVNVDVRSFGVTGFSFYTHYPAEVDLSFVEKAPFFGCGTAECKGAVIGHWFSSIDDFIKFIPTASLLQHETEPL